MARARHMWPSSKAFRGQLSITAEMLHRPTNAHPSTEAALLREVVCRIRTIPSRAEAAHPREIECSFHELRRCTEVSHRFDAEGRSAKPSSVTSALALVVARLREVSGEEA